MKIRHLQKFDYEANLAKIQELTFNTVQQYKYLDRGTSTGIHLFHTVKTLDVTVQRTKTICQNIELKFQVQSCFSIHWFYTLTSGRLHKISVLDKIKWIQNIRFNTDTTVV